MRVSKSGSVPPCSGPISRRELLRFGMAGLGSLSLPGLFRARTVTASEMKPQERTALIVVWLPGGASHIETYDPKPDAPSEFRGPFSTIPTNVEGLQICELLPRHAAIADRFTVLRSLVHTGFCHQQGTQQLFTGHEVRELRNRPDHPDFLSIAHRLRFDSRRTIPNYIGVPAVNYSGAAYLGPSYEPFAVTGDPNAPEFKVPNTAVSDQAKLDRLGDRLTLRKKFDLFRRDADRLGNMAAFDSFESQAWNMLSSPATGEAFDLSRESESTRDRYGRNLWGQRCLLARRLVEAGVDLVTVQFDGPLCGRIGNWDDHAVNHDVFAGMKHRTPYYDHAVCSLIEDLYDRGLDRRVMVVVLGEFGRTPKINYDVSTGEGTASAPAGTKQPGRDHWPRATSLIFAGGGIATGRVIGATDSRGEDVTDRIVGRGDFLATMYRHLGIDPEQVAFTDHSGRPIPIIQTGAAIPELVSAR
nr:DUF1501 domain-containing protein [Schlesneria paludicola]